ncbi:glycosyltransferase [Aquiflexum sp. TKW24L]|uniref:glycosyltransferase family A protein n=1 Tax=Aquiflexum sp. TKW24L TaxID=2942212 RepID=UPI0020C0430E|nr:glycosyltransferase [Aquiflexum sp. TKW24L]MCL6259478.1 glycosyltransferase [Aquiflexum sp. TKW24L]
MLKVLVITPVKNSVESTLECAQAIASSNFPVKHIIFNDFSAEETKQRLEQEKGQIGYELIHLEDITDTPSPNYKLVLQMAQKEAVNLGLPLIVVESDVIIKKNTIQEMIGFLELNPQSGLIGAITVGEDGKVNFPYLKFKSNQEVVIKTERSLSFCCTLFSPEFLSKYDFMELDDTKDWYDTFMSKKSVGLGFDNYVLMNTPVLHRPHGSRPWKLLKYSNPFKYYFLKFWKGRDKI